MRFLIVDDDPAIRRWLRAVFSRYAHCHLVFDGNEAVTAVRLALEDHRPYDLITLDIMMPGIDGHETLRKIRQLEKEHGIGGSDAAKVIMTTALDDPKHCIRSFREGCESYCTKPLKKEQILDHVWTLLGELPEIQDPQTEPDVAVK